MTDWYYLSYATQTEFLGGAYVLGDSQAAAYFQANALGINPGGEVKIVGPLPSEHMDEYVPEGDRERLLSRAEVQSA